MTSSKYFHPQGNYYCANYLDLTVQRSLCRMTLCTQYQTNTVNQQLWTRHPISSQTLGSQILRHLILDRRIDRKRIGDREKQVLSLMIKWRRKMIQWEARSRMAVDSRWIVNYLMAPHGKPKRTCIPIKSELPTETNSIKINHSITLNQRSTKEDLEKES